MKRETILSILLNVAFVLCVFGIRYFYVKKEHIGVIAGIPEFMSEFTKEDTWGEDGYLVDKGLIPLDEASRTQWSEKINNFVPLEMN